MNVGKREIILSLNILIPQGDEVKGTIRFGDVDVALTISVQDPKDDKKQASIWWEFSAEKKQLDIILYAILTGFVSSSSDICELGSMDDKTLVFTVVFSGTSHVCDMRIQFMRDI